MPAPQHFQDDCTESGHWEHKPRRGKAEWCFVWLGVMHEGGREVSLLACKSACKPGTFNLPKLLPFTPLQCQRKPPEAARLEPVERDVHTESLQALRDREIKSALAQPYSDYQPSSVAISSSASLLHPCRPSSKGCSLSPDTVPRSWEGACDMYHYSGP